MSSATRRVVAFLFADMEGSTDLVRRLGDGFATVLSGYRDVIETAVDRAGGATVDTQGDGHFAAFPTATGVVTAAVDVQRGLAERSWPDGIAVKGRLGLHIGEVLATGAGYVGIEVHRASRVGAAAHGGQVLLSQSIADLVAVDLPDGVTLRDLGAHRFKDLARPEVVYQLDIPGLPDSFPPIRTEETRTHNLPFTLNRFVGRDRDVAALVEMLSEHRLVTLTGPGGVGKTRLAAEVAVSLPPGVGDIWFADLAKHREGELVATGMRAALELPDQHGFDPLEAVLTRLSRSRGLLIVDNCEHVLSAARSVIRDVLHRAPDVTVLATSQTRLDVPEEVVWPVKPLLGDDDLDAAVDLFTARAVSVNPGLDVEREMASIGELCRRLDGIPLAIELAASRCSALTPTQILDRIDDRFRLIARRGADDRHGSLRATVEWSLDLLDADELALFEALAVFPAGFTMPMAERMAEAADVDSFDVLDILTSLVDKSLVIAEEGPHPRYRYLDTMRTYALGRVEPDRLRGATEAFVRWAEGFIHMDDVALIPVYDREVSNLEAVVERLAADGEIVRAAPIVEAVRLSLLDHQATWRRLIERLLEREMPPGVRAQLLTDMGWCYWTVADHPGAVAAADEAEQICREASIPLPVWTLPLQAAEAALDGNRERARAKAAQVLALAGEGRTTDVDFAAAIALAWTGTGEDPAIFLDAAGAAETAVERASAFTRDVGGPITLSILYRFYDVARSLEFGDRAVAGARVAGQRYWLGVCLCHRGMTRFRLGDLAGAVSDFVEGVPHSVAVGDVELAVSATETIARVLAVEERHEDAAVLLAGSLAVRDRRSTTGTPADLRSQRRLEEKLQAGSSPEALARAQSRGRSCSDGEVFDVAVRFGRELLESSPPS